MSCSTVDICPRDVSNATAACSEALSSPSATPWLLGTRSPTFLAPAGSVEVLDSAGVSCCGVARSDVCCDGCSCPNVRVMRKACSVALEGAAEDELDASVSGREVSKVSAKVVRWHSFTTESE